MASSDEEGSPRGRAPSEEDGESANGALAGEAEEAAADEGRKAPVAPEAAAEAAAAAAGRGDGAGDGGPGGKAYRNVFVANLPPTMQPADVTKMFADEGVRVDQIDFKDSGGFCFVHCEDTPRLTEVVNKLNGRPIAGDRLCRCEFAKSDVTQGREEERRRRAQPSDTLFVVNYDTRQVNREMFREIFEPFGTIQRLELKKSFAFVQFTTVDAASNALARWHGSDFEGRTLTVEFVVNKNALDGGRRRGGGGRGGGGGGGGRGGGGGGGYGRSYDDGKYGGGGFDRRDRRRSVSRSRSRDRYSRDRDRRRRRSRSRSHSHDRRRDRHYRSRSRSPDRHRDRDRDRDRARDRSRSRSHDRDRNRDRDRDRDRGRARRSRSRSASRSRSPDAARQRSGSGDRSRSRR